MDKQGASFDNRFFPEEEKLKLILLSVILILCGVANALAADTYVFKDVLRPGGHDRTMAQKQADYRKCGAIGDRILTSQAGLERCMNQHGWTLSKYIPDPSGKYQGSYQFTDVRGAGKRGDAALHADTVGCDRQVGGGASSAAYQRCMLSKGWQYYMYTPPAHGSAPPQAPSDEVALQPGHYIDPDSGLDCVDHDGWASCGSPQGTVHYFDSERDLNCTRSRFVNVCTNL